MTKFSVFCDANNKQTCLILNKLLVKFYKRQVKMEKENLVNPSVVTQQTWAEEAIIGGLKESLASRIKALEVNQEHFSDELEKADERIRNIEINSQKIEIVGKICEAIATPAMMRFLVTIAVFLLFPKADPLIREVIQETQPLPKQEIKDGVLSS